MIWTAWNSPWMEDLGDQGVFGAGKSVDVAEEGGAGRETVIAEGALVGIEAGVGGAGRLGDGSAAAGADGGDGAGGAA
jgi:hypothetical protein